MAELDRVGDHLLGKLARPDLDHVDGIAVPRKDHVEVGVFDLGLRGIDDELAVNAADARRAQRPAEWDRRDRHRRVRRDHRDDVRIVLQAGREHHDLNLDLVLEG